jgi:hypothetical protein
VFGSSDVFGSSSRSSTLAAPVGDLSASRGSIATLLGPRPDDGASATFAARSPHSPPRRYARRLLVAHPASSLSPEARAVAAQRRALAQSGTLHFDIRNLDTCLLLAPAATGRAPAAAAEAPHLDGTRSSLHHAIVHDGSREMVEWLLACGHERPDFSTVSGRPDGGAMGGAVTERASDARSSTDSIRQSRGHCWRPVAPAPPAELSSQRAQDARNATMVQLASSQNRPDLIEAICLSLMAHLADEHARGQYVFPPVPPRRSASTDEEDEEEDVDADEPIPAPLRELLDWQDDEGRTALQVASVRGFEECARVSAAAPSNARVLTPRQLLLDLGADPDLCDVDGNTPLHQ